MMSRLVLAMQSGDGFAGTRLVPGSCPLRAVMAGAQAGPCCWPTAMAGAVLLDRMVHGMSVFGSLMILHQQQA